MAETTWVAPIGSAKLAGRSRGVAEALALANGEEEHVVARTETAEAVRNGAATEAIVTVIPRG